MVSVRTLKIITILSALLLLVSGYFYYFHPESRSSFHRYRPLKTLLKDPIIIRKRIIEKQKIKKLPTVEMGRNLEDLILQSKRIIENNCQKLEKKLDNEPDLIDPNSDYYRDPIKAQAMIDVHFSSFVEVLQYSQLSFRELEEAIFSIQGDISLSSYKEHLKNYEGLIIGCSVNDRYGMLILTLAESFKAKGTVPKYNLSMISQMAQSYLSLNSLTAQMFAIGVLNNLNITGIFSPLEVYDLEELTFRGKDISSRYKFDLSNAQSIREVQEVLQNYEIEKEVLAEYIYEFTENIENKYEDSQDFEY